MAGLAPNHPAHSTVSTSPGRDTVEPPSGGDSSANTRSAATPVAPAPIRHLIKTVILAATFFIIHAAATHLLTAVLFASACITITALAARRSTHA